MVVPKKLRLIILEAQLQQYRIITEIQQELQQQDKLIALGIQQLRLKINMGIS